jgi:hypothetical protein
MDAIVARKTWRTLEPYHGMVYFAPEALERFSALGLEGSQGYFASRSAAMGAVRADVVIATFFNFNPALVRRAIPSAWEQATPEQLIDARVEAADDALRRVLGDELASPVVARAAESARRAAAMCTPEGRPLYAAHSSLPWPDDPHLVLWHAITLLREYRGDGHIACLVDAGIDGCEALVQHAASGDVPRATLQSTRAWSDDDWEAAVARLADRGLVDESGAFTPEGRAQREQIERHTDELALRPWRELGEDGCAELRAAVRPLSKAIVASGALG